MFYIQPWNSNLGISFAALSASNKSAWYISECFITVILGLPHTQYSTLQHSSRHFLILKCAKLSSPFLHFAYMSEGWHAGLKMSGNQPWRLQWVLWVSEALAPTPHEMDTISTVQKKSDTLVRWLVLWANNFPGTTAEAHACHQWCFCAQWTRNKFVAHEQQSFTGDILKFRQGKSGRQYPEKCEMNLTTLHYASTWRQQLSRNTWFFLNSSFCESLHKN